MKRRKAKGTEYHCPLCTTPLKKGQTIYGWKMYWFHRECWKLNGLKTPWWWR